MTETKTTQEIFNGFNKYPVDFRSDERWILEADVLRESMELKQKIIEARNINTEMLRSEDPKSDRRRSVLSARIETLSWVLAVLGKETNK